MLLTKLSIAFLGMTLGGVTFLIAGLALFLTINQLQHGVMTAQTPAKQSSAVQYAQYPPQR